METNAYLERMNQLKSERIKNNKLSVETAGLPIHKPNPENPSGIPVGNSPKPQEDESYKDSHFYMQFNHFKENDEHFGGVAEQLTQLATGLRKQVQAGYLPPQIAEQKIHQFVMDSQKEFIRREPQLKKEAEQKQMLGMLSQLTQNAQQQPQQQQSQQMPPEGISAKQAMNGGQPNGN
ncbi:hypothetical protein PQC38_gp109 [Aeromonas phage BUCT695]|uniref:hypothetical protein n=1 Tax=Aeromonas phage BUCT695 TaxID=2908630 RepID=UPI00232915AC|nr:hypothetical protein PQC38_gp109 [Aeromonas phage BUCT695]UIW10585.1 hypothetical protein [Aeromonas phage BUCT695]